MGKRLTLLMKIGTKEFFTRYYFYQGYVKKRKGLITSIWKIIGCESNTTIWKVLSLPDIYQDSQLLI